MGHAEKMLLNRLQQEHLLSDKNLWSLPHWTFILIYNEAEFLAYFDLEVSVASIFPQHTS